MPVPTVDTGPGRGADSAPSAGQVTQHRVIGLEVVVAVGGVGVPVGTKKPYQKLML